MEFTVHGGIQQEQEGDARLLRNGNTVARAYTSGRASPSWLQFIYGIILQLHAGDIITIDMVSSYGGYAEAFGDEDLDLPSATTLIKSILQSYPDNSTILKELIQNAEDAEATEIKFLLDENQYGGDRLFSPDMQQFQGPALYAYNNGKFEKKDWRGIKKLHESIKAEDEKKIGRFGVGFKSVFHMTDMPGVLSENTIGFMDPQAKYLPSGRGGGQKSSFRVWRLDNTENKQEILKYWDQFNPFFQTMFSSVADTFHSGSYRGQTLFRFPLRMKESEISRQMYKPDQVNKLFKELESDAHEILLFLTNLKKIEVYRSAPGSRIDRELLFSISKQIRQHKIVLNNTLFEVEILVNKDNISGRSTWFIYRHPEECGPANIEDIRRRLCVQSNVSVALRREPAKQQNASITSRLNEHGRLFCFLPLPMDEHSATGLKVHINASFGIDLSRRNIALPLPHEDINTISDNKVLWNLYIMQYLIPVAMVNLTHCVAEYFALQINYETEAFAAVYAIMPDVSKMPLQWQPLANFYYKILFSKNYMVWYSVKEDGCYERVALHDNVIFDNRNEVDSAIQSIRKLWHSCKLRVISVPQYILIAVKNSFRVASVEGVVIALKSNKGQAAQMTDADNCRLLRYLIKNLQAKVLAENLIGTKLLPLNDGSWTCFMRHSLSDHSNERYLPSNNNPSSLLPGLDGYFVKASVLGSDWQIQETFKLIANEGTTQVVHLTPSAVVRRLGSVPYISKEASLVVENTKKQILTVGYLEQLWTYLNSITLAELEQIELMKLHLIPKDKHAKCLARLHMPILMQENYQDSQLVCVLELCGLLDIVVVDLPYSLQTNPTLTKTHILHPTLKNIIDCMLQKRAVVIRYLQQNLVPDVYKTALRKYIVSQIQELKEFDARKISFVRELPIFPTVNGSGFLQAHCVSTSDVSVATSGFNLNISIPEKIISINDPESRILMDLMKVKMLDPIQVVKEFIFQGIHNKSYPGNQDQVMIMVLSMYQSQLESKPHIESLKSLPFVETSQHGYTIASQLYDNSEPLLSSFFAGQDVFPVGEFSKWKYRNLLLKLGLKQINKLTRDDIIKCARKVDADLQKQKSHVLMKVVEKEGKRVFTSFMPSDDVLQNGIWFEAEKQRPENYPSSFQFVAGHAAPSQLYPYKYAHLVGSVHPTINTDDFPGITEIFDLDRKPNIESVVKHLENFIEWFQNRSNSSRSVTARRHCEDIYKYFEDEITRNKNLSMLLPQLFQNASLFIETNFVPVSRCVFNPDPGPQQCLPWLCSIPKSMINSYKKLLESMGVKEMLSVDELLALLKQMHSSTCGVQLNDHEYKVVRCIVSFLCFHFGERAEYSVIKATDVYFPDAEHILRPASALYFNEAGVGPVNDDESDEQYLCDLYIAEKETLQHLGIQSRNQHILDSSLCVMPFGQTERLVTRINGLLNNTPFSTEFFKEFIQNADDAGATKIHFIMDARQLPSASVFDQKWKPVQGPAFCIFNDKPFAEKDFLGIQNLGTGSKNVDATKIGQYGIGFNCVYHFTDVPMILTKLESEKRLCILDPTLNYVSKATRDKPGCMYKNIDYIKRKFPDVFRGFLEEEYSRVGGTFIRLPLRKIPSEISDTILYETDIIAKFQEFQVIMAEHLLFVKNLKEISLLHVSKNAATTEVIASCSATIPGPQEAIFDEFQKKARLCTELKPGIAEVAYDLTTSKSGKGYKAQNVKWKIVQRVGFDREVQIPQNILDRHHRGKLNVLPHGGVAFRLPTESMNAIMNENKACLLYCYLPLPGRLSLPVSINGHFFLDHDSRRTLLNEETGGNKKGWNEFLIDHVIVPSYCKLIVDMQEELRSTQMPSQSDMKWYFSAFPNVQRDNLTGIESKIALAFYKSIANHNVLPVLRLTCKDQLFWTNSESGYFDMNPISHTLPSNFTKPKLLSDSEEDEERDLLRNILIRTGLVILQSSNALFENFKAAKVKVKDVSPKNVLRYYASKTHCIFPNKINDFQKVVTVYNEDRPVELVKDYVIESSEAVIQVLRFCSKWDMCKEHLHGTPLLVTEDDQISSFSRSDIKFLSTHSGVVPHALGMFIHQNAARAAGITMSKVDQSLRLCQPFAVHDFIGMLPGLLEPHIFKGNSRAVHVSELTEALATYEKKRTKQGWLCRVWKFLDSEIEIQLKNGSENSTSSKYKFAITLLSLLSDWHLLPVCRKLKSKEPDNLLLPLKSCTWIMMEQYMKANFSTNNLYDTFIQLGFPYVKEEIFVNQLKESTLMRIVIAEKTKPSSTYVISALIYLGNDLGEINKQEQMQLLRYLSRTSDEWQEMENVLDTLKRLPYYLSVTNKFVSLNDYSQLLLFPEECHIPSDDINEWTTVPGTLFLRFDRDTSALMKALGCRLLTEFDLYVEFILNSFSNLSENGRYLHLKYIMERLFQVNKIPNDLEHGNSKLLNRLKTIPVLLNEKTGHFDLISHFYNPNVQLFKLMEDSFSFPLLQYSHTDWVEFLTTCGLITEVSCEILERYVCEVAKRAEQPDMQQEKFRSQLEEKSEALATYIISTLALNEQSKSFLNNIKDVPFIFPHSVSDDLIVLHLQFEGIHGQNYRKCIAFKDSYPFDLRDLVWSVGNILPECTSETSSDNEENLHEKLQLLEVKLKTTPNFQDIVVQHTINICSSARFWHTSPKDDESDDDGESADHNESNGQSHNGNVELAKELYRVMKEVYSFLNEIDLSPESLQLLRQVPCIVINHGKKVVAPHEVTLDLGNMCKISPYLVQLPPELKKYTSFIKQVGVIEKPTPHTYADILARINENTDSKKLDKEETKSVMLAVYGILTILDQATPQMLADCFKDQVLFLPGCYAADMIETPLYVRLYSSNVLVRWNKHDIEPRRMTNFKKPFFLYNKSYCGTHRLDLIHAEESNLSKLPTRVRPSLLSEEVQEVFLDTNDDPLVYKGMEKRIHSLAFRRGIARLVSHACHQDAAPYINQFKDWLKVMETLQIHGLREMKTYLINLTNNCKIIEGSTAEKRYFFDGRLVRINRTTDNSPDVLNTRMAEVLDELTGSMLTQVRHCIAPIINNCSIADISKRLDELDIAQLDTAMDEELFARCAPDEEELAERFRPYSAAQVWNLEDNYDDDFRHLSDDVLRGICKKWLQQATLDFKCAEQDVETAPEWACYKCHQAAEKALKAVLMCNRVGVKNLSKPHDICGLASRLQHAGKGVDYPEMTNLIRTLDKHLGYHTLMRYPEEGCSPCKIPRERYSKDMACTSRKIVARIIEWATGIIVPSDIKIL